MSQAPHSPESAPESTWHPGTRRVVEAAAERGVTVEPRVFDDSTRTAEDAAAAVGVTVAQIVKSLVFIATADSGETFPVVALVNGADRCDTKQLAIAAGAKKVARASADDVRQATGFAIGGVAPCGYPEPLPVFVDETLLETAILWAAAGTPHCNFSCTPAELLALSAGRPTSLV